MQIVIALLVFFFGAAVGSFLNVLTMRLGTGLGVVRRGSFCFSCGRALRPYELVPIVSYLLQRGRCRGCKAKMSVQYPLVEFLAGAVFLLIAHRELGIFGFGALGISEFGVSFPEIFLALYYFIIFSLLLALGIYDVRHKIIPNQFVYPFIALSFAHPFLFFVSHTSLLVPLLAGPLLFAPFALTWLISGGRWMGFGDAKLAWGMGWLLGVSGGFAALVLSFWIGAVVGIAILWISKMHVLQKKYTIKSEVPFGPFLVIGTFLAYYFNLTFLDLQMLFFL